MNSHRIGSAKGLTTTGALSEPIDDPVIDAFVAEGVAAYFERRIFKRILADLALQHGLYHVRS